MTYVHSTPGCTMKTLSERVEVHSSCEPHPLHTPQQEKEKRVSDMEGKVPPRVDTSLVKELKEHPLSPK